MGFADDVNNQRKELTMADKNMLREALREIIGPLGQLLRNLAGNDSDIWLDEFKKFLRREPCWVPEAPVVEVLPEKTAVAAEVDQEETVVATENKPATVLTPPSPPPIQSEVVPGTHQKLIGRGMTLASNELESATKPIVGSTEKVSPESKTQSNILDRLASTIGDLAGRATNRVSSLVRSKPKESGKLAVFDLTLMAASEMVISSKSRFMLQNVGITFVKASSDVFDPVTSFEQIATVNKSFREFFGDWTESSSWQQCVHCMCLHERVVDGAFFEKVGGRDATTTLKGIFYFYLRRRLQPTEGDPESQLQDKGVNVFFVKDKDDIPRVVSICKLGEKWSVFAKPITEVVIDPATNEHSKAYSCLVGTRVFSACDVPEADWH